MENSNRIEINKNENLLQKKEQKKSLKERKEEFNHGLKKREQNIDHWISIAYKFLKLGSVVMFVLAFLWIFSSYVCYLLGVEQNKIGTSIDDNNRDTIEKILVTVISAIGGALISPLINKNK